MKFGQYIRIVAGFLSLIPCLLSTAIEARDLDHSDQDRLAILNAARPSPSDKFVVKDLIKDHGYAYLCGLIEGTTGLRRTDGKIAVYQFILRKESGHWQATNMAESADADGQALAIGTTDSSDNVDCTLDGHQVTGAEIQAIYKRGN
ncbi:hypothetical protein BJ928_12560 [Rhizobium sp. WW_1]|nr:hypothetical protein BJ928_12560 [Rhizobium sp. WW_1]